MIINIKDIESDYIHFRIMRGDSKEHMLFNYLNNNFFIDEGYNSPNLYKGPSIIRKYSSYNFNIYGKNSSRELNKIFGFDIKLTEEVINHWIDWNCKNITNKQREELWEDPLIISVNELNAHRTRIIIENMQYITEQIQNSMGIPLHLLQS